MHQDILTEVLGGQAEREEGGAKDQGRGQVEDHQVVVMETHLEAAVDEGAVDGDRLTP